MIFQELILQNFGPYRDRHTLHLHPRTANAPVLGHTDNAPVLGGQPIILIGSLNGGGKTTLMDAIRLTLYGQRAQCSSRGNLAYHDFLNQSRNRYATDQPTQIELCIHQTLTQLDASGSTQPDELRIRRTWYHLPKNGRDDLEVFLNGAFSPDLTNGWDERIEAILPLGISNLFLFDGEQVKDLAEDLTLPPTVINAIRNLLGLELPDRLSTDLDVLISRKRKLLANQQDQQKLDEIEQTLATQEVERKTAHQACAHLRPLLERAEIALKTAQEQFIAEGGKIAAEKAQLELQLAQAKTEQESHQEHLRDLASGPLPLMLVKSLLTQAQTQAQAEIKQQQFATAQELIQTQQAELLEFIQTHDFSPNQIQQIQTFLADQTQQLSQAASAQWLGVNLQQFHRLSHILEQELPNQVREAQQTLKALQENQAHRDSLDRYLATAAAPEIYEKLANTVRDRQATVTQLQADLEQASRCYQQAKQAIERTKKDLASYSQQVIEFKNTDHFLQSAQKVQATLAIYKQRLKLQKLNHLETLITECFLYLLHKSNLVHRVQIDTDSFALYLFDHDGEPVPKHRLSAGEKQLLAIALLWGLARASGRHLPVAIDTPLGRLDSKHRQNLVERYFPQASHQVILLSTDTEIRDHEVGLLREQGAIAREYLLKYDHNQRCSEVVAGYFW
ncbi:MAG: DNA sulfur modification protein DndD [Leptolyngbyaceae bacterium]|nr:DNA sulfur modification protein DndD [Leptolyngbyaceae bacterium]